MLYSLTDKLKFAEKPKIEIKGKTFAVDNSAKTVLEIMDIVTTQGEIAGARSSLDLLFNAKDRKEIEKLNLTIEDYVKLASVAMDLALGNDPEEDQKELVDSICERYWQLCDAEISEALSLHAPSSPESGMTFSTVYIDAYGHLVSEEEDFDAAISLAAIGETESGSTDAIHQLALSVHRHRAATACELESELAELEAQDARKKILDSQPDLEDV